MVTEPGPKYGKDAGCISADDSDETIRFSTAEYALRFAKALKHAIILCGGKPDITGRIDELRKHYKRAGRLSTIPAEKKAREYRRCRCRLGREIVRISLIIRNLGFNNFERKRLINRINTTMDTSDAVMNARRFGPGRSLLHGRSVNVKT